MARNSEKAMRGGKQSSDDMYFYGDDYVSDSDDEEYLFRDDSGDEDFMVKAEGKTSNHPAGDESDDDELMDDHEDVFQELSASKSKKQKTSGRSSSSAAKDNRSAKKEQPKVMIPIKASKQPSSIVQLDHNYSMDIKFAKQNSEHSYIRTGIQILKPGQRRKGPVAVRTEVISSSEKEPEMFMTFKEDDLSDNVLKISEVQSDEDSREKSILGKKRVHSQDNSVQKVSYSSLMSVKCSIVGGIGSKVFTNSGDKQTKTILLNPKTSSYKPATVIYPKKLLGKNMLSVPSSSQIIKIPIMNNLKLHVKSSADATSGDEVSQKTVVDEQQRDVSDSINEEAMEDHNTSPTSRKFKSKEIPVNTKLARLHEAEKIGHANVCRKYNLPSSTLSTWKKQLQHLLQVESKAMADIENQSLASVLRLWDTSMFVTSDDLLTVLSPHSGKISIQEVDKKWITDLLTKHSDIAYLKAPLSNKLPGDLEDQLKAFYKKLKGGRIANRIGDNNIISMDEIPLTLGPENSELTVLDELDGSNPDCSLIVSCCSDGVLLPTLIVVRDDKQDEVKNLTGQQLPVTTSKEERIDGDVLCYWINNVLKPFRENNIYKYLLVWDEYTAHKDEKVTIALHENKITPIEIPAGCSTKAQALNMGIKQCMKNNVLKQWYSSQSPDSDTEESENPEHSTNTKHKWSVADVVTWVNNIQTKIKKKGNLIKHAFRIAGTANSLDGSDGTVIRNDESRAKLFRTFLK